MEAVDARKLDFDDERAVLGVSVDCRPGHHSLFAEEPIELLHGGADLFFGGQPW